MNTIEEEEYEVREKLGKPRVHVNKKNGRDEKKMGMVKKEE